MSDSKNHNIANDPDNLEGNNTYVNPVDGKVYQTDGQFKKHEPAGETKKYEGPVQPTGLVLLTQESEIPRVIGIRPLVQIVKEIDAIVVEELAESKDLGRIVIQCTLYHDQSGQISLAYEGQVNNEYLNKIYHRVQDYCADKYTRRDTCVFQQVYSINNFVGSE